MLEIFWLLSSFIMGSVAVLVSRSIKIKLLKAENVHLKEIKNKFVDFTNKTKIDIEKEALKIVINELETTILSLKKILEKQNDNK